MLPYMDVVRCLQVVKQLTVVCIYIYRSYPTAGDQGDYSGTESSKHQLVRERLLAEDHGSHVQIWSKNNLWLFMIVV